MQESESCEFCSSGAAVGGKRMCDVYDCGKHVLVGCCCFRLECEFLCSSHRPRILSWTPTSEESVQSQLLSPSSPPADSDGGEDEGKQQPDEVKELQHQDVDNGDHEEVEGEEEEEELEAGDDEDEIGEEAEEVSRGSDEEDNKLIEEASPRQPVSRATSTVGRRCLVCFTDGIDASLPLSAPSLCQSCASHPARQQELTRLSTSAAAAPSPAASFPSPSAAPALRPMPLSDSLENRQPELEVKNPVAGDQQERGQWRSSRITSAVDRAEDRKQAEEQRRPYVTEMTADFRLLHAVAGRCAKQDFPPPPPTAKRERERPRKAEKKTIHASQFWCPHRHCGKGFSSIGDFASHLVNGSCTVRTASSDSSRLLQARRLLGIKSTTATNSDEEHLCKQVSHSLSRIQAARDAWIMFATGSEKSRQVQQDIEGRVIKLNKEAAAHGRPPVYTAERVRQMVAELPFLLLQQQLPPLASEAFSSLHRTQPPAERIHLRFSILPSYKDDRLYRDRELSLLVVLRDLYWQAHDELQPHAPAGFELSLSIGQWQLEELDLDLTLAQVRRALLVVGNILSVRVLAGGAQAGGAQSSDAGGEAEEGGSRDAGQDGREETARGTGRNGKRRRSSSGKEGEGLGGGERDGEDAPQDRPSSCPLCLRNTDVCRQADRLPANCESISAAAGISEKQRALQLRITRRDRFGLQLMDHVLASADEATQLELLHKARRAGLKPLAGHPHRFTAWLPDEQTAHAAPGTVESPILASEPAAVVVAVGSDAASATAESLSANPCRAATSLPTPALAPQELAAPFLSPRPVPLLSSTSLGPTAAPIATAAADVDQLFAVASLASPLVRQHQDDAADEDSTVDLQVSSPPNLKMPVERGTLLQNPRDFNNMLPAFPFIRMLQSVMRSVVRLTGLVHVDAYSIDEESSPSATAFLISRRLLLTNHHVLCSAAAADHHSIRVRFDDDEHGDPAPCYGQLRPADFFFTDPELDISVVAFSYPLGEYVDVAATQPELKNPQLRQPLVLRETSTPWHHADTRIIIVGHPVNREKQLSMSGHRDATTGVFPSSSMSYSSDTLAGSGGSPILDMQGQLLGVHYGSGQVDARGRRNRGTLASAVFNRLLGVYESCRNAQTVDSRRAVELLRECLRQDKQALLATHIKLMA